MKKTTDTLDHPLRRRIVEALRPAGGLNESGLANKLGLARGTLRHHLGLLARSGYVTKFALGRESHYFLVGSDSNLVEALARVYHGRARQVLRIILSEPGIRQKDLCTRLGLTRKVLGGHLQVLKEGQLVEEIHHGRVRRYYPGQKMDDEIWKLVGPEGRRHQKDEVLRTERA